MESEMNNRKVVLDEEMLKLKKIVVECLGDEDESSSKEISNETLHALQSELQTVADELSEINYFPSDPDDDIDNAVTRTLESLECPVTIEIERIGYGEYYLDRKLYIKLGPKGEPLVKNGNGFITLTSYVKRLYAPFFTTEKYIKEEEQLEIESQALQSSKFESLLQKLSKTRDYINNLQTTSRSGSNSPPASPPRRSSPLRNNTTLNLSQLNNSNESPKDSSSKLSPRDGPKLIQKKERQEDDNKEGRPSSAPPNTRYINILQRAEKNKKLLPIKPTPQVRRPPPNSMTFDRRNSPLPPNYVMHNNNLLFVKQPATYEKQLSNYEQVLAAHQSVKKPIVPQKSASTNNSRASSPRNHPSQQQQQPQTIKSTMFGSIDLGDPKQLEKLKKQALRMQIQQFSQKPIH
ncbi:predicted protein [Naegleria gruberi]|uniref:Predicted protein n=1 Tax=Naegleria gruberi TaxID=5762 RepID=D2V0A0_NAEGR|nr:uncharacterized protein NAEGRDRAFT_62219 [Naegleria gruberi]EFC49492.1 predicted protein [Naegleria gruberi]|eukprot:XP_002682236.1 predicted protein [Naegleria gruberi strain NEG-M]